MSLPGIAARPLVTLNGEADFSEVFFFDDVRVPADALLGPLNAGWHVATSTLSYAQMNLELTDELSELRDTVRRLLADKASIADHVRPLLDDPTGTTEALWQDLADVGTTRAAGPRGTRW